MCVSVCVCVCVYGVWESVCVSGADLNLPSVSLRSEERLVRSTENLSTFTLRILA